MELEGSERQLWVRWRGVRRVVDRTGRLYATLAELADDLRSAPVDEATRIFPDLDDLLRRVESLERSAVVITEAASELRQRFAGETGRPGGWLRREDQMLWSGRTDPLGILEEPEGVAP
ncbi:MAG: hypothetical protein ACRDJ4_05065 [Actinomycetota bacterium]